MDRSSHGDKHGSEERHDEDAQAQAVRAGATSRSMFGQQVMSTRPTAPSFGFGSGPRVIPKNMFISSEHVKDCVPEDMPGPDHYEIAPTLGKQRLSKYQSAPELVFGTSERFGNRDRSGPGPAAYSIRASSVGKQLVSTKSSSASYGFGSATRDHTDRVFISTAHSSAASVRPDGPGPANKHAITGTIGRSEALLAARTAQFSSDSRFKYASQLKRLASTPGPGAYALGGSIGRQLTSNRATSNAYGFGSGDRRHAGKVFISSEHAKTVNIDASPGPAIVAGPSAFGKSSSTRGPTSNSWSFSKADRFGYQSRTIAANNTPGPGSYSV